MATSSLVLNLIVRDQSAAGLSSAQKRFAGLATAAAGLTAGLGAVVTSAASFDKTIRQVGAAAQVPAAGMKTLSDLALKMGADTSFSAKQAADAMLELAKGGISEADIRAGALKETLTLAAAGGLELGSAAGYMSNALNTFGLQAKDAGSVAAALAGGANASTASVESLGMALGQVGPGARNAGLSLAETTAVLAAFDNAGIKGSDAGTSLKTMLTRLVPSTDAARSAMADLGLKFTDATGAMLPITNIAEQIRTKMAGLSDEQRTLAMNTIFGSDATRAATVLMQEGSAGLGEYISKTSDLSQAQKMAATNTAGAAGAFEAFKGSVETLGLRIGLALLPAVERLTRGATEMVNGLGTAFEGASAVVSRFRASMAAGTNPFAPMLDQVQTLAAGVHQSVTQNIIPTIRNLITLMSPLLLDAFKVVGAVVVGVLLPALRGLQQVSLVVGAAFRELTEFMAEHKTAFQVVAVAVGTFVAVLKGAALAQLAFNASLIAFGVARTAVVGGLAAMRTAMIAFNASLMANPIGLTIAALAALAAGLVYAYKRSETFRNIVNGAWAAVRSATMGVLIPAFDAVRESVDNIGAVFSTSFRVVATVVRATFQGVQAAWTSVLRPTFAAIVAGAQLLGDGFRLAFNLLGTIVRTSFRVVQTVWTSVLRPVFDAIVDGAQLVGEGVRLYFRVVSTVAQTTFRLVMSLWQSVLRVAFNAIVDGARLVADGFRLYFRAVSTVVQTTFRLVMSLWQSVLRVAFNAIVNSARLLADGFRLYFRAISTVVQTTFRLTMTLWQTVLRVAFLAIQAGARTLMTVLQTVFRGISTAVQTAFRLVQTTWQTVLRPTFDGVMNGARTVRTVMTNSFNGARDAVGAAFGAIRGVWQNVLSPAFNRMQDGMKAVRNVFTNSLDVIVEAFRKAVDGIGRAWGMIRAAVSGPARVVYNVIKGLRNVLAKFAGVFGVNVPELPSFDGGGGGGDSRSFGPGARRPNRPGSVGGGNFATGGIMPGYTPGRDNQIIAVGGGEAIMRPEWTRAVGPGYVNHMNAVARAGGISGVQRALGIPGFDLGGVVGGITKKVKSGFNGLTQLPEKAWEYISDPTRILTTLAKPILGRLGDLPGNMWGDTLKNAAKSTWDNVVGGIQSRLGGLMGMFGGGGGYGSAEQQRNAGTIISVGRRIGASQRDLLIALMTALQESGLRNINYGDRDSVGLFQQRTPWGSFAARMNPSESARMFFQGGRGGQRGLFDFSNRNNMSLTQAAQAVQVSAFPNAYAKWEDEARALLNPGGGGGMSTGAFSPGLVGGLNFARANAGEPYVWGGVGPYGFDCSGFIGGIQNTIMGRAPYRRLYTTHSFYGGLPPGWRRGGGGAFSIGVVRQRGGTPGHMAGTINGVNVESRGGRGTLVGPAARGTNNALFTDRFSFAGFAKGGVVRRRPGPGDPPFDLMNPKGMYYSADEAFDMGGIMRGRGFMPKYTGSPERVLSPRQTAAFESWMNGGSGGRETHVHVHNHGVIGSRMDVENWLVKSMKNLEKQGRL